MALAWLNRLQVLLRLAHELAVLSHGHFEEAARKLGECGRLLGGWVNQQAGRDPATASVRGGFELDS